MTEVAEVGGIEGEILVVDDGSTDATAPGGGSRGACRSDPGAKATGFRSSAASRRRGTIIDPRRGWELPREGDPGTPRLDGGLRHGRGARTGRLGRPLRRLAGASCDSRRVHDRTADPRHQLRHALLPPRLGAGPGGPANGFSFTTTITLISLRGEVRSLRSDSLPRGSPHVRWVRDTRTSNSSSR